MLAGYALTAHRAIHTMWTTSRRGLMGSGGAGHASPLGDPAGVALIQVLRDESLAVKAAVSVGRRVDHGRTDSFSWTSDMIWNATDSAASSGR